MPEDREDEDNKFCTGPSCIPNYNEKGKQIGVICPPDCSACLDSMEDYDEFLDL